MPIEIRTPSEPELRAAMEAASVAFAESFDDADWDRERLTLPFERAHVAFDGSIPVGLAGAIEFELTVPGGVVPCAGVTWVGVLPTHRRRGVLRQLMVEELRAVREWGEPVAALWASEASIYGRFGYGVAAVGARIEADSTRLALRDDQGAAGSWRLVDAEAAYPICSELFESVRRERPGFLSRSEHRWRKLRLADNEQWRQGASQKFIAVLDLDGAPAGYAIYRVKDEWERGFPKGTVRVTETLATSAAAEREVWRYLAGIDLTNTIDVFHFDPAAPLFLMVRDPRALHLRVGDALWIRFADVEAALRARTYADADAVVLDVRDEFLPENAGRYRVAAGDVVKTDNEADLSIDVTDLASAYLGAFSFEQLSLAGRVDEHRQGAVARASTLFRTTLPPFCPEVF